jgi:ATP synthase protein I
MHKANQPPEKNQKIIRAIDVLRLMGFGWYFASCLVAGVVAGYFIDRWLDTKPAFILGGLLLGGAAGFYGMYKMLLPLYRGESFEEDKSGKK